jgi:hypothetical protein
MRTLNDIMPSGRSTTGEPVYWRRLRRFAQESGNQGSGARTQLGVRAYQVSDYYRGNPASKMLVEGTRCENPNGVGDIQLVCHPRVRGWLGER